MKDISKANNLVKSRSKKQHIPLTKNTKGIKKVLVYSFLIFCAFISLYPVYFAIISSLKENDQIFLNPLGFPTKLHFENYARAWKVGNVGVYFLNSLFMTLSTMLVVTAIGTMAAYALSRLRIKYQGLLFVFFISGMMIPIQSTIIPLSFMFGQFQLRDNYAILILLFTAFQLPITIFILNGFMKSIPSELEEAAIIDGSTHFIVYTRIIMPMSVPAIVTVSIFNILSIWNNLLFPLVFISKKSLQLMSIGLLSFFAERQSDYSGVMAAIVISILPPLILYILLQEKVEKGLTSGALKG